MMKKIVLVLFCIVVNIYALEAGKKLVNVKLQGDNGGYLDGKVWNSIDINAKVNIIFYVDPDMKDLNDDFARELQKLALDKKDMKVFVIVNMDASWIPNALINQVLISKQKEFPEAIYVKDNSKVLVHRWGLKDDEYNTMILRKNGDIIFSSIGKIKPIFSKKIIRKINDTVSSFSK